VRRASDRDDRSETRSRGSRRHFAGV